MTDKVQKIREEVEKLHGNPYYMMAVKDVLKILDIIDSPCNECEGNDLAGTCASITELGRCPLKYRKEEPVSDDLEEAAFNYAEACKYDGGEKLLCVEHFKAGAEWNKKHQTGKDVLDVIEKELTRRMLEDYNEGAEEDEIAQGCMASLIMFVRQMKEE